MGEVVQRENAAMWPTPTVHGNDNYKGASAKSGDGLMTVIKRREGYPTPQARDYHSGTTRPHGWAKSGTGIHHNLNDFVLRFPTPKAKDAVKCSPGQKPRDDLKCAIEMGATKSAIYPTPRVNSLCGGTGAWNALQSNPNLTVEEKRGLTSTHGQLNPDWEEWLMFWPVGWTDIETPNVRLVWLDPLRSRQGHRQRTIPPVRRDCIPLGAVRIGERHVDINTPDFV